MDDLVPLPDNAGLAPLALAPGRTIIHQHPEALAITQIIGRYLAVAPQDRLLILGVDTWDGLATTLLQTFKDAIPPLDLGADPAATVQRFARSYVAPGLILSDAIVREGLLDGQRDLNIVRQKSDALAALDQDIAAARAAGAKPSELAALYNARTKLQESMEDSLERHGIGAPKRSLSEVKTTQVSIKVDSRDVMAGLGGRPKGGSGPVIDISKGESPKDT